MEKDKAEKSSIIGLIFIVSTLALTLLNAIEPLFPVLVGIICLPFCLKKRFDLTVCDCAIILFTIIASLSSLRSITPAASANYIRIIFLFIIVYLIQKHSLSSSQSDKVILSVNIIGLFASTIAISTFIFLKLGLTNVGFQDYYSFRHLFRPFGYINNAWAEIAIFFIGFAFMANRCKPTIITIVTIAGLLTFCRGFYLALFAMMVYRLITRHDLKSLKLELLPIITSVIAITIIFPDEISSMTMRFSSTDSWRVAGATISATDHSQSLTDMLFGYGGGAFSKYYEFVKGPYDTFTNTAPNFITETIVNYGIIGCVTLLIYLFFTALGLWRHRRNYLQSAIGAIVIAIILKELIQTSISSVPVCAVLAGLTLGMTKEPTRLTLKALHPAFLSLILCMALLPTFSNPINYRLDSYRPLLTAAQHFDEGDYRGAIEIANNCHYSNITAFITNESIRQLDAGHVYDTTAWVNSIIQQPALLNLSKLSASDTATIIKYLPQDVNATTNAKIGSLLATLNRKQKSHIYLKKALEKQPSLVAPWKLIGDTIKYNYLSTGHRNRQSTNLIPNDTSLFTLIMKEYAGRQAIWYGK